MSKTPRYQADSLEVLSGLDPVRRRPGMFTDTNRPNHLAHEVIDNSIDEALAGHCTRIQVTAHADGSLSVQDNGRGMPVDKHQETGLTGVELILTKLHAGAKFSRSQYRFSGGLHGVGVSVVNALSESLNVTVWRNRKEYRMRFEGGERKTALRANGASGNETGTRVQFWPDARYFDNSEFHIPRLREVLRTKAILCPGLTVAFTDEVTRDSETTQWHYPDGLPEYLTERLEGTEGPLPDAPLRFGEPNGGEQSLECVVQWARTSHAQESYVNLVPTPRHGTHVRGLRNGLTEALREFCEFRKLLPKSVKLAPADVWHGVNFILSLKLAEPQFAGQTKESLASRAATPFVAETVKAQFALWLNRHTEQGEQIALRAIEQAQARLKASKKTVRKSPVSGPALPGKLADCASTKAEECELFLVEGDSAGGSARQARSRETQAILPLRGKIMNTWEVSSAVMMNSKEIHDIAVALGMEPDSADLSGLRYHRVCILADADSDGLHIATLICALFAKHFPALVLGGHVFVVMPPLYRLDIGKQKHYALSDEERDRIIERFKGRNISVTRFKGLGEMSAVQLRETAMAPDTRKLVRLTMEDAPAVTAMLDMLLAKKRAADRKHWLETKGNLAA